MPLYNDSLEPEELEDLGECIEHDECGRDEDGIIICCEDCPAKKVWKKILSLREG